MVKAQNPFVERLIGSIRREALDHVIVLDERHLRRVLREYIDGYYHPTRTHLSLAKDAPSPRPVQPPELGMVVSIPVLGGMHHRYERRAARPPESIAPSPKVQPAMPGWPCRAFRCVRRPIRRAPSLAAADPDRARGAGCAGPHAADAARDAPTEFLVGPWTWQWPAGRTGTTLTT